MWNALFTSFFILRTIFCLGFHLRVLNMFPLASVSRLVAATASILSKEKFKLK